MVLKPNGEAQAQKPRSVEPCFCMHVGRKKMTWRSRHVYSVYESFFYVFWQDVEVELEMGPTKLKPKAFHPALHGRSLHASLLPCTRECHVCVYIVTKKHCKFGNLNPKYI